MEGFSDDRSKALEASAGERLDSWKEIAGLSEAEHQNRSALGKGRSPGSPTSPQAKLNDLRLPVRDRRLAG